jgi:16S rRNA (cytosine967-C5)-methyltransferase
MFVEAYIETASHLTEVYDLQMPLNLFLKEFFKSNRKFGSRDRKLIAELVYGYYRLGKQPESINRRHLLICGAFLSGRLPLLFFEKVAPYLADAYDKTLDEKWDCIQQVAPFVMVDVSDAGNNFKGNQYLHYLYTPPKVFIRIRQHKETILRTLANEQIPFEQIKEDCLAFDQSVQLQNILSDADYVIQDYASQMTGDFFHPQKAEKWWDCCCASGGKSILLLDKKVPISLTVSDIRSSILNSFHPRMMRYNYQSAYTSYVLDATLEITQIRPSYFDKIICDVPCSGSGTWRRTPEQFYFFTDEKLEEFHQRQVKILSNVLSFLKPEGVLYYITCSVFRRENEDVLAEVSKEISMECVSVNYCDATKYGGDYLFLAVLKKKS